MSITPAQTKTHALRSRHGIINYSVQCALFTHYLLLPPGNIYQLFIQCCPLQCCPCQYNVCRPVASQPGGGGLNLDRWNTGADTGFLEGGGGEDIHKHPPLEIVRVTSSALQKIEKHPHSWTFTSTPPLDIVRVTSSALRNTPHSWTFTSTPLGHCPCDVIHTPRGVIGPCHPPPGSATGTLYTGYGWAVYIMAETRSLVPIAVDG